MIKITCCMKFHKWLVVGTSISSSWLHQLIKLIFRRELLVSTKSNRVINNSPSSTNVLKLLPSNMFRISTYEEPFFFFGETDAIVVLIFSDFIV